MKKLRLDDLVVETFVTAATRQPRGTVEGHQDDSSWCSYGSPQFTGCDFTCEFPCGPSDECTPACPGGTDLCTHDCPGTVQSEGAHSGCDFSCEFAC